MLKKILCGFLLPIMLLSCLTMAGCGGTKKTADTTPVIHWYMKKPVSDMSRQAEVEAAANEIIYGKLGVKLQFHFIEAAAWADKTNVMLSSGAYYDILSTAGAEFITNARKDAFANLTEGLAVHASAIKAKVPDFAWFAVTFGGEILAVPSQTFYVPYSAFAFQKALVDKYGFDYEKASSYEAIAPFLRQIKENEPGLTGLVATANGGVESPKTQTYSSTNIDFIYFNNKENKFEVKYFGDEIKEQNRVLADFYKKGYIARDAISKTESVSEMKSGRYAVVNGRRSAEKSTNLYGFECVESEPTYGAISTNNVLNSVTTISANSKYIDESIKLLNLIWEDSYLSNLLAYGIEGKDFTVDKGDIHNYADISEIHITTNSGTNVKWSIWHNWLGPLWDQWDSPWNTRESLLKMQELNESAEVSPILGFIIDVEPIKTELAQMTSIYKDAEQVLRTGTMGDFDTYMSELEKKFEAAGINTVMEEINNQYTEWKSHKNE